MLAGLPKILFWDVDPETIDPDRHSRFIVARVMQFGGPLEIGWLLRMFPEDILRAAVCRSRTLDRKTAHFWGIHFGIPLEEIACLKEPLLPECCPSSAD